MAEVDAGTPAAERQLGLTQLALESIAKADAGKPHLFGEEEEGELIVSG